MKEVWIVDGVRTPIGRMGGALSGFRPEELAAFALKGLIDKTKIDPAIVEDVLIGHACTNNMAVNIGRWAVLKAGFPVSVTAQTVERQCGSALQTINSAAMAILAGFGDTYIAGGCESCPAVLTETESIDAPALGMPLQSTKTIPSREFPDSQCLRSICLSDYPPAVRQQIDTATGSRQVGIVGNFLQYPLADQAGRLAGCMAGFVPEVQQGQISLETRYRHGLLERPGSLARHAMPQRIPRFSHGGLMLGGCS